MRLPRASGVLLHPTSLPGPFGAGDLGAQAHGFVDWLASAGQRLWQILPLGGVGPGNSPYMSTSAFAGNVLLIDLAELQSLGWLSPQDLAGAPQSDPRAIDFDALVPWRMARLQRAAAAFAGGGGAQHAALATDYAAFCVEHADWLDDYALFMALAAEHPLRGWADWPPTLALREARALAEAARRHAEVIALHKFCQWRFFRQWAALKRHANLCGVRIVGDTPIFIAHHSAEAWARPELFELDAAGRPTVVAGVPPDVFSATGQRWGNPLYRWSSHTRDGFAWWVQRVRRTFELVDLVRIDHFRGFAACWEIDAREPTAVHGRWVPAPGEALFDAIARALGPVPIIAEDLGVITPDVVALRRRCGFPGMRILQFAFGSGSANPYLPHNHEADSVVYTGTHDNDTTRGWWAKASPAERQHVHELLACDGTEIHWDLVRAAMASVADTAIVPMQDVLGLGSEARMNFPGQGEGWWRWRFTWDQVRPEHAARLAQLARLYRRDGTPLG
ncbi:MAG: 4-alpha-glucanotransferase [Rubrivivax sp.]|nr:4-alpha-glucanotransferase [Rubrivivax sp.]